MRAGDVIIILAGLALVTALAAGIYSTATPRVVRVTQGAGEPANYPAWENRKFSVSGPRGETVVEIRAGQARILRSPCRQKLCIRAGWLDAAGDAAACVPNRVSVALLGGDPRFDAINF